MTDTPLVSIITPVLNGIKYLEPCIHSVLNQSYPYIEHVLVDGGSTDGTVEMLRSYQAKYPERIRFISERDKGVGDAVNKGFRIAKGDIFCWLDSDDVHEPEAVQTVVDFFHENPDAYFVYGYCDTIKEEGDVLVQSFIKDFEPWEAVNYWYGIMIPAVFYKREVIEKVGGLNELGNDLDFFLRVYKKFKMHRIEKKLATYRSHSGSLMGGRGPRTRKMRRDRAREDFFLFRRYGGGIFSKRARRYYGFMILGKLHLYDLKCKLYPKIPPIVRKALEKILYD
jgi:glycosyltransferase involved in cell wall biosynthesis